MEQALNGIRDTFYQELAEDYRRDGEESFLYEYFWQDSARELWEKAFPSIPVEEPLTPKTLQARLSDAMAKHPDRAKSCLLREPPGEGRRERRDFWQELTLNGAGFQAGLITDTDYYVWLTQYLAVRDIYYKDSGPWDTDGCAWLHTLLRAGLGDPERSIVTKAQTERDLKELARLLRDESHEGAAERLHLLKKRIVKGGKRQFVDYLPWLTKRLKLAALHSKIKTWLQDGGYPFLAEKGAGQTPKSPRKQDFSMRLFDAYCASPAGYDFAPKNLTGWHMYGREFCVMDTAKLEPLIDALKRRRDIGDASLYLPLALHLQSGCVFFLAGSDIYRDVDNRAANRAVKGAGSSRDGKESTFSFGYFKLDKAYWEGGAGGPFHLHPDCRKNAGKSYDAVFDDFRRYCLKDIDGAIETVRDLNQDAPAGTPAPFLWAFYSPDEPELPSPSRAGRKAFYQARRNAPCDPRNR